MRLVSVQNSSALTRQTSPQVILDFLTVADENAEIAHGLTAVTDSTGR
jgi:hypothetical protein